MSSKERSWFEQNMHAEKSNFANCSACSMRNIPKFCETLAQSCLCAIGQEVSGFITWQPNDAGLGYDLLRCIPSREMVDWFRNTPTAEIRKITAQMVLKAVQQNQK